MDSCFGCFRGNRLQQDRGSPSLKNQDTCLDVCWILAATLSSAITLSLAGARYDRHYYAEFVEVSAWIKSNVGPTVRVATDFPVGFEWQNDRYYYNAQLVSWAEQSGTPADKAITSFARRYNISLFMVQNDFAQSYGFAKDPNLTLMKKFPHWIIYSYHCLNCTETS